jgi:hypothetical protein
MGTVTSRNLSRSPTIWTLIPILPHQGRTIGTFTSLPIYHLATPIFDIHQGMGKVAALRAHGIRGKFFIGEFRSHGFDILLYHIWPKQKRRWED